jgi:hypothetical protein
MEYNQKLEELQNEIQMKRENIMKNESDLTQTEKQFLQLQSIRESLAQLTRRCEELQLTNQQTQSEILVCSSLRSFLFLDWNFILFFLKRLQSKLESTQKTLQERIQQRFLSCCHKLISSQFQFEITFISSIQGNIVERGNKKRRETSKR